MSFEEAKILDQDVNLTIVDGIIGQVLANIEFRKSIETLYEDHRETDDVPELVSDAQIFAEMKWDLIVILAADFQRKAFERGIVKTYKTEYLNDPELPEGNPLEDSTVLEKCIDAIQNAERVGCRIIINTPKIAIIETVWLRNFEDARVSPLHIAINIAELLAFKKALDLIGD